MIAVATYKRPDLLCDLLSSLEASTNQEFRVVIVDNDPSRSAREVALGSPLRIEYVVEPTPGIAAARNAALDRIAESDDFILFVDDDERVDPIWLDALLRVQTNEQADVIAGPVISVFAPNAPSWILKGGFIQRARFATGDSVLSPATNNTLVRVEYLRSLGMPHFSESFSMTGGSDTEYFRRLRAAGAKMVWCNEALVYEDVPPNRATFAWIWRRGIREGNVSGRLRLREIHRPRLFIEGVARVLYGVARQTVDYVSGRGPRAKSFAYITRGLGWIGASRNQFVIEYARPDASGTNRTKAQAPAEG